MNMTPRIVAVIGCIFFPLFIVSAQPSQSQPTDEQIIRDLIARHADASQTGDFDRLVSGYRADSDVRYADGVLLDGQQAIEQHYRRILEYGPTAMAHSHPQESIRIRFLRDDVAFADVVSLSGGGIDEDGNAAPERRVSFFVVFTKIDNEWGVAIERMGPPLP